MTSPTTTTSSITINPSPHVAIAGAGPAGLLLAILLAQINVRVTLLEKSAVADPWTSKSYSINLNVRGLNAFHCAGILEDVKQRGMARERVLIETFDGKQQAIPRDPPHYAFTRPALVECLETILLSQHGNLAEIRRGVAVTGIELNDNNVSLLLDDNTAITCTHVVGADGKWSAVRQSIPSLQQQFEVQTEPSFGISVTPVTSPEQWDANATIVVRGKNPKYYAIISPLPNNQFSSSLVCFDEIQEDHPWLKPRDEAALKLVDWEAEYGVLNEDTQTTSQFQEQIAQMLEADMPKFFEDIRGRDSMTNLRVNRRTSWLKPVVDDPCYCDESGRVVLIGDAAHAMTPAIGEGCNCALESAVSLVKSILKQQDDTAVDETKDAAATPSPLQSPNDPITPEDLTFAFQTFGKQRPKQVIPFQLRSAAGNRYQSVQAAFRSQNKR